MLSKYKTRLLTKWFVEWVFNETDVEALEASRQLIEQQQDVLTNRIRVIGFQQNQNTIV